MPVLKPRNKGAAGRPRNKGAAGRADAGVRVGPVEPGAVAAGWARAPRHRRDRVRPARPT